MMMMMGGCSSQPLSGAGHIVAATQLVASALLALSMKGREASGL